MIFEAAETVEIENDLGVGVVIVALLIGILAAEYDVAAVQLFKEGEKESSGELNEKYRVSRSMP